MNVFRPSSTTCRALPLVALLASVATGLAPPAHASEPDTSGAAVAPRSPLPHRRSNWQLGSGGAGTLEGSGWSAVATYERVLNAPRSLVVRGEFVRVLDRGQEFRIEWSIPEWQLEGVDGFGTSDAWVSVFALSIGARYVRPGQPVHAYIESSLGPALEQSRGKTRASALVGVSAGGVLQPVRSPLGGFAELRMGILPGDSGILVTGRGGLLFQSP